MFCNQMRFKALSSLQTVKRVGVPSPLLLLRLMLDILASSDSTKNGPKVWVLAPVQVAGSLGAQMWDCFWTDVTQKLMMMLGSGCRCHRCRRRG